MSYTNQIDQKEQNRDIPPSQTSSPPCFPSGSMIDQFQKNNPQQDLYIPSENSTNPYSPYYLSSKALGKNKIDPIHRYKLMKWLQSQVFRQKYYRQVFGYSAYYFDLYTSKIEKIASNDLHDIGLACLLIATKIEGAPFPNLGADFSMEQLIILQKRIAYQLNYFLYPKHHVYILNQYIQYWQKFIENSSKTINKQWYSNHTLSCFQRRRSLFQKMDYMIMLYQSFNCGIQRLALNLFFLENKLNFMEVKIQKLQQPVLLMIIRESYIYKDEYMSIFHDFMKMWAQDHQFPPLDIEIGLKCAPFLALPISTETPNRKCFNYNSFFNLSTFSQDSIKQLDRLAKKNV